MLVLLAGIFVVHIATVVMLFVSTIANVWMAGTSSLGTNSTGLWLKCDAGKCHQIAFAEGDMSSLKAVQAFMILAIIFSFISLVMFVVQLFTMEKGKRFYITGAIMLICWLFILIAVSIYTARFPHYFTAPQDHHGYSFILAWICFCFSLIIGILYLVLRKK
ncbi:A disintegrin and metalloproteinase with thrombospondin motifs 8 [Platysternon megacephalum]|uniref:Epithelial membrane protein 1 n=1 Tax=Platysternon megacephalum TaxID=55544 RepID=A0A4D9EBD2_9SAUR|nr:A disintegrin and metalloproteinase with thrombospondin motifs 8 [Platysternon megacephalum]